MPIYRNIIIFTVITLSSIFVNADPLKCYSCSTLAGARNCTYDYFSENNIPKLSCPEYSNVCATITVVGGEFSGHLIRKCGVASASIESDTCKGGYYSPSDDVGNSGNCLTYKCTDGQFKDSDIHVCAYKGDLSNNKK